MAGNIKLGSFFRSGRRQELSPSLNADVFVGWGRLDPRYYLARYPDVREAGFGARRHYFRHGRSEGRYPNAKAENYARAVGLDPYWYLARYLDVHEAGLEAHRHYASHGRAEGRFPNAGAEAAFRSGLAKERSSSDTEAAPHSVNVDSRWYLARYPDVRRDSINPLRHYTDYGHREGRFPNHDAEVYASAIAEVDPRWYLARYPDVAKAGLDPRQHYADFGRNENRYPSSSREPREAWNGRFDPLWYAIRNSDLEALNVDPLDHFRQVGIFEGRAPNPTEEDRRPWMEVVDSAWYLDRNPDVRQTGIDPLEHFIHYGIVERRRPSAAVFPVGKPVAQAKFKELKSGLTGNEVALLVTFSNDGTINPHVPQLVAGFKDQDIDCILVVACDTGSVVIPEVLMDTVEVAYLRDNVGFDFAAWAHLLRLRPDLWDAGIVYLVNDSIFGPTGREAFAEIIGRIRESDYDVIGLTDNVERGWHIQSYMLAIKSAALASPVLRGFMRDVVSLKHKDEVVNEYETQLASLLEASGLRCETIFPTPGSINATLFNWRKLIEVGFPFLKVSTARGLVKGLDIGGWRELMALQGYDPAPADNTLAALAARAGVAPLDLTAKKFNHRQAARAELHAFFASGDVIDLPAHPNPVISILIVVYNEAELTYACLQSLVATIDVSAEFIIVDNASTDDTVTLLDRVRNVRVVRNVEDMHFLRAANQAAARARGRALLFLNNDVRLEPDAVRYGLETLDSSDDIAAVGAKLILPDGLLQEAGSIIWRDGACLGFGRGQSPDGYQYNFRREVDFCSGAYMLMRRDVFEQLKGFDVIYAPAYYEETDLCMRIRAAGYSVMYDPRVVVNHYEFASVAFAGEQSALMRGNLSKFLQRHAEALAEHHYAQSTPLHLARSRDRQRTRLLVIDNLMPLASYGAGFPRTNRLVWALHRAGFLVTYYPAHQEEFSHKEWLAHCPVDVEFVLGKDRLGLIDFIESRAGSYDGMIVCRPNNMMMIREHFLFNPALYEGTAIVYDAEAVCAPRDAARDAILGRTVAPGTEGPTLEEEVKLSDIAGLTIVVNERDAGYFRAVERSNVGILGHSVAITPTSSTFEQRCDFLLVGRLDHDMSPNIDSLFWFIEQVMPRLDVLIGKGYRLLLVGQTGSAQLAGVKDERISVFGRVDDVSSYYDRARVFLGPTRYAAGMPLKIYEAAAHGVPTVITPVLAEQLGWRDGEQALVAGDPDAFAEACRRLYTDASTWSVVRDAALKDVRRSCDAAAFDERMLQLMGSVGLCP